MTIPFATIVDIVQLLCLTVRDRSNIMGIAIAPPSQCGYVVRCRHHHNTVEEAEACIELAGGFLTRA